MMMKMTMKTRRASCDRRRKYRRRAVDRRRANVCVHARRRARGLFLRRRRVRFGLVKKQSAFAETSEKVNTIQFSSSSYNTIREFARAQDLLLLFFGLSVSSRATIRRKTRAPQPSWDRVVASIYLFGRGVCRRYRRIDPYHGRDREAATRFERRARIRRWRTSLVQSLWRSLDALEGLRRRARETKPGSPWRSSRCSAARRTSRRRRGG